MKIPKKRYRNSLCLMKAYPFHLGHEYLINTALENSENVHIIVCYHKGQSISGGTRMNAIWNTYKSNPNVHVHGLYDGNLPQYDTECETKEEFYGLWVPEVRKLTPHLDAVFTSEEYGDDFAHFLGVEHFLVDKERYKFPISGTEIRENVYKHWDMLSEKMKHNLVKRVAIMGPESVGKSTMAERLAKHFNTNFVEEYGRTVYENNGNKIDFSDFVPISIGRQNLENEAIKKANKILFCDTEDITTYLFLKMYFPDFYLLLEEWFLMAIRNKPKYDVYILLKPDCEAIQDGTRNFLEERWKHYNSISSELTSRNFNVFEVGGNWDERYDKCIEIINKEFNI